MFLKVSDAYSAIVTAGTEQRNEAQRSMIPMS